MRTIEVVLYSDGKAWVAQALNVEVSSSPPEYPLGTPVKRREPPSRKPLSSILKTLPIPTSSL